MYGRGIDFICLNKKLLDNGGVHVIQTFLSEDISEEVQIQGRTARQGQAGSYSMCFMNEDLEKYLGTSYLSELDKMRNENRMYSTLDKARNEFAATNSAAVFASLENIKREHDSSQEFLSWFELEKFEKLKGFLIENNKGPNLNAKASKTICLMDATGSMANLLLRTKENVSLMFERILDILKDHSLLPDLFELELAVYRDYDCLDKVLQVSGWETNPLRLRQFMTTVNANGGGDIPEAIEIGLWHVNKRAEEARITQVILIGDAPAKTKDEIKNDRTRYGGEEAFWSATEFKERTHYKIELDKIKERAIPIHAFYVGEEARSNFEEIAFETGGKCEFLDVNSLSGGDRLTDVISTRILSDVGEINGIKEELVKDYLKKYPKTYV